MKVIASQRGYYGDQLREVGDVFTVPDDTKPASWFAPEKGWAEEKAAPKADTKK
jgi:hypothetical protein